MSVFLVGLSLGTVTFASVSLVVWLVSLCPLLLFLATNSWGLFVPLGGAGSIGKPEWEECSFLIGMRLWQSLFPWTVGLWCTEHSRHSLQWLPSPLPAKAGRESFSDLQKEHGKFPGSQVHRKMGPSKTVVLKSFCFSCQSTLSLCRYISSTT